MNSGPITTSPTNTMNPPTNAIATALLGSKSPYTPYSPTEMPTANTTTASTRRRTNRVLARVIRRSPIAAIGGVRAARTAGNTAASIVMPTPTTAAATNVRPSTTSGPPGTGKPICGSSHSRKLAERDAEREAHERTRRCRRSPLR